MTFEEWWEKEGRFHENASKLLAEHAFVAGKSSVFAPESFSISGGFSPRLEYLGCGCIKKHKPVWEDGKVFRCPDCGQAWTAHMQGEKRLWGGR